MYELYCKYRDKKGYKDSDVSRITGIPQSTFTDWKKGRSKPNTEKLSKIANCLDTMVEYLDHQTGSVITCPDCGLTYATDVEKDIEQHKHEHVAWQKAENKFGTLYANYPIREKIKARNRAIQENENYSICDRCNAALEVLRCLYSRSVQASGYNLKHISYEKYVAMMLANKTYGPRLDVDIFQRLKNEFGTLPGIDRGTYYRVPDEQLSPIAAHKDGENFTPEELQKIEEYKKLLIAARPKE